MMMDKMIQANLDDMKYLSIEVCKKFYDGMCTFFYLRSEKGKRINICIEKTEDLEDRIKYHCSLPEEVDFSLKYTVVENHGRQTPLLHRFVVKTKRFQELFSYEKDDLGANYYNDRTEFALWAPTATSVLLEIEEDFKKEIYPMVRSEYGVYRTKVKRDLSCATYVYYVEVNGSIAKVIDPYALSTTINSQRSAVIDLSKIEKKEIKKKEIHPLDAILYECSVRDLTKSKTANTKTHGTYGSFIEKGAMNNRFHTGFDYIRSLGITHLQLMPVFDFATVDEESPNELYNWGYDPIHFFGPEGSLSSNPYDPYVRVQELRTLVDEVHQMGMYVNLDIVMNHHYDAHQSQFHKIVPYYYFRYTKENQLSDGTFCGNEFQSELPMVRKYFIDQLKMWTNVYGIDGFRFDLMGIFDVTTMNQAFEEIKKINPSVMMYGEGWTLPTVLDSSLQATIVNQKKMPMIGHFSDRFRDVIKGSSMKESMTDKGYCTGDITLVKLAAQNMAAQGTDIDTPLFDQPHQVINYTECHDNQTLWDKIEGCCFDEDEKLRVKRQKMIIASTLFAQGIPFLHCGQEFCRTKQGEDNTYNMSDEINQVDWNRMVEYQDVVQYTRSCIMIRKNFESFRLKNREEIKEKVTFDSLDSGVLIYDINHEESKLNCKGMVVIINPTPVEVEISLNSSGRVILDENGFKQTDKTTHGILNVAPCTVVVYAKL